MKFMLTFDGTLIVGFEPHEITEQIEFLVSIEPGDENASEKLQSILLKVMENNKPRKSS